MFAGLLVLALTTGANATLPNAFWAEFFGTAHIGAIKSMAAAAMVLGSAVGPGLTGLLIDLGVAIERQFLAIAGLLPCTTGADADRDRKVGASPLTKKKVPRNGALRGYFWPAVADVF